MNRVIYLLNLPWFLIFIYRAVRQSLVTGSRSAPSHPLSTSAEEEELQLALALSQQMAEEERERRQRQLEDEELEKVLKLSLIEK